MVSTNQQVPSRAASLSLLRTGPAALPLSAAATKDAISSTDSSARKSITREIIRFGTWKTPYVNRVSVNRIKAIYHR